MAIYDNGNLSAHVFYKNGKEDGEYKTWFANGKPWKHCFYKNDGEYTVEDAKQKFPEGPWL